MKGSSAGAETGRPLVIEWCAARTAETGTVGGGPDELGEPELPDCDPDAPEQSLATQAPPSWFTGVFADVDGVSVTEPTCTVPAESSADWSPVPEPPEDVLADEPDPPDCDADEPEQSLATHTGVLLFTGAFPETAGLTVAEPTCTVPIDSLADWSPVPEPPEDEPADEPEPPDCDADEPEQSLATHTGVLAFTGAFTAPAGLTVAEPTWPVTIESLADWSPAWLWPDDVVVLLPEPDPPV